MLTCTPVAVRRKFWYQQLVCQSQNNFFKFSLLKLPFCTISVELGMITKQSLLHSSTQTSECNFQSAGSITFVQRQPKKLTPKRTISASWIKQGWSSSCPFHCYKPSIHFNIINFSIFESNSKDEEESTQPRSFCLFSFYKMTTNTNNLSTMWPLWSYMGKEWGLA